MRVIYIDVLFFINFYITYFLILGAGAVSHKKIALKGRLLGSAAGGISSFVILLPEMNFVFGFLGKLLISAFITLLSMGFSGTREFLKNSFLFFLVNCVYAGITLALWLFCAPMGMVYNNGVSYFQIPLWGIILFTSAAYLILKLLRRIIDSKTYLDKKYSVEITTAKGMISLTAIPDSGNKLIDFFTGLPVIFCDFEKCRLVCPDEVIAQMQSENLDAGFIHGVKLIPCSTVSGTDTAICFKPQKILITESDKCKPKQVDALIGFTKSGINNKDFESIFNPQLLT